MSQITIYRQDEIEDKARKAAKAQGKSVSRWLAEQVAHKLEDAWPQSVLDAAGAIPDFPALAGVRKPHGSPLIDPSPHEHRYLLLEGSRNGDRPLTCDVAARGGNPQPDGLRN